MYSSDNNLRLAVFFTEFGRITPFALPKLTVKVAQCIESATIADLCNRVGGVHESSCGIAQTDVPNIFREVLTRAMLEVAAKSRGCHTDKISQFLQTDFVLIMLVDIVFNL